jgi:hypothetical protein
MARAIFIDNNSPNVEDKNPNFLDKMEQIHSTSKIPSNN